MTTGPDLLRPYEGTGQRVTIRRQGPSSHTTAPIPDHVIRHAEVVTVYRTGAKLNELRSSGQRAHGHIDATTVYHVEPEENTR